MTKNQWPGNAGQWPGNARGLTGKCRPMTGKYRQWPGNATPSWKWVILNRFHEKSRVWQKMQCGCDKSMSRAGIKASNLVSKFRFTEPRIGRIPRYWFEHFIASLTLTLAIAWCTIGPVDLLWWHLHGKMNQVWHSVWNLWMNYWTIYCNWISHRMWSVRYYWSCRYSGWRQLSPNACA